MSSISRLRRCFVRKGVLSNFAKFTGKHLCQSLFFNKAAGLKPFFTEHLLWSVREDGLSKYIIFQKQKNKLKTTSSYS